MGKRINRLKPPYSESIIAELPKISLSFLLADGSTIKGKILSSQDGSLILASRIGKKIYINIQNISEIQSDILADW